MIFCDICKKSFPRKFNYERHLTRVDHISLSTSNSDSHSSSNSSSILTTNTNNNCDNDIKINRVEIIKKTDIPFNTRVVKKHDTKDINITQTSVINNENIIKYIISSSQPIVNMNSDINNNKSENREVDIEVDKNKDIVNDKAEEDVMCKTCGHLYSNRSNLNRHIKKCIPQKKTNKMNEEFYQEQIIQMQNQINILINKMGSAPTYVQNINQKIENTVNQQNIQQININAYGKENMDYITLNDMHRIIKQPKACLPKFIELLHYDENHPENHNVILESIKNNMIKILHDNNRWAYQIFEKFVEQFTMEKYDQLYDLLLDYDTKVDIDEILKDKFEKWADRFDNEDSNTRKKAEEDVKLALIGGGSWLKSKGKKRLTKRAIMKGIVPPLRHAPNPYAKGANSSATR